MVPLALAWYGYVPIVGAAIVTLGATVGVLTDWGRTALALMRRLRRRRLAPADQAEPTDDQRQVLNAVCRHLFEHGRRAPFRQLDKELDRVGVELRMNQSRCRRAC